MRKLRFESIKYIIIDKNKIYKGILIISFKIISRSLINIYEDAKKKSQLCNSAQLLKNE